MTAPSTAEYDAFGPWLLEVDSPGDLPPLFADVDLSGSRLAIKVPRQIERRYASPSMDLYDFLVVAADDSLTVLSRSGQGYSTTKVRYQDIVLIEESIVLLNGVLRVVTALGDELLLPFNAVSEGLIARLVGFLRANVPPSTLRAPFVIDTSAAEIDLGRRDVWLTNQLRNNFRAEPDLQYFGGYGRRRLTPRRGGIARASHLVRPAVLHAVVACGAPTELLLLSSRNWLVRTREPDYSRARTFIRPSSVVSVSSRDHPDFLDVDIVSLRLGSALVEYPVLQGSRVESTLLALSPI